MKTITICGSLRFEKEMKMAAEQLALEGNCVLLPLFPVSDNYTEEQRKLFGQAHRMRIRLSDAIYVVNVDGYIGPTTQREIGFAKELGREVLYYA